MARRSRHLLLFALAVAVVGALAFALHRPFPSDQTPEGAYMRLARALTEDRPQDAFAYLETEAQWACFTIHDLRKKSSDRIAASYPEPTRSQLLAQYEDEASAADGSDIFGLEARAHGWDKRLRRDLSGAVRVDVDGDRATVVTARGTRYPFRKRDNGIWGLTIFTADLLAESDRAARDEDSVVHAADDYDRVKNASASHSP